MFFSDCLGVADNGNLSIGGCDTVALAKQYGTPLYVMDESMIRGTLRLFKSAVDRCCESGGMVLFASKAASFKELYRIVAEEGVGIDVVSGGELYTAMQVDFPAERIYFHGNNKTETELRMALAYGVGRIVVDNMDELYVLSNIASEMGRTANVHLRIAPGVDAHTHDFVRTGQIDSKFGFTLSNGDALRVAVEAVKLNSITLKGVHCHIGSQIFDGEPFAHAAEIMIGFMSDIQKNAGVLLPELNLGGGFGIKYTNADDPRALDECVEVAAKVVSETAKKLGIPAPYILIEPGRSVVAPAGITLYTVGSVKDIPDVRKYAIVDGGMADNPRYALYKSTYTVLAADCPSEPGTDVVTVAGRCCESGDLIQENVSLPHCRRGDVLAVLATGAYNYSMSSNYNRLPRPAIVMTKDGESRVVVKAETYADVARNDV